ncbi:hypothetical protein K9N68_37570 (plasmid) [Kovacikia minuta CCNUW1]|uniref:hypothetical protein n=1 Tax=Kovacikia minuta TaxID=2931930 RepID=UPI001CCBCA6B|nr:hypothetical protein [Kovacikia minuta]UBF29923.1 hypothetical protein K9N68_37570 [Kovacikia minuta CCNUW1]
MGSHIAERSTGLIRPPVDPRAAGMQGLTGTDALGTRTSVLPQEYGIPQFFSRRVNRELQGGDATFPTLTFGNLSNAPGYRQHLWDMTVNNPDTASILKTQLQSARSQMQNASPAKQGYLSQKIDGLEDRIHTLNQQNVERLAMSERYTGLYPGYRGVPGDVKMSGGQIAKTLGMTPSEIMALPEANTRLHLLRGWADGKGLSVSGFEPDS